jgi:DNA-binding GntR family transcriptional regulator
VCSPRAPTVSHWLDLVVTPNYGYHPRVAANDGKGESTGTGTRYSEVADALKAAIADGQYTVGSRLPTEFELCEQFGVSRSTVRQALAELETAGLAKRRQGSGTTVVARTPAPRYSLSIRSDADILRYAMETVFEISESAAPVSVSDSRRLRLGSSTGWRVWRGLRKATAGGPPLGIARVYVPIEYLETMTELERRPQRPIFGPAAAQGLTVTAIEQDITAIILDDDESELLGASKGSPALAMVRRYFSGEHLIEVAETMCPADRFTYDLRLDRAI